MPISLICGACEASLTAPDAAAGKRVKCKKCGAILEVPMPEADYEVIEEAPTMMLPPIKKSPPAAAKAPPPAAKAVPQPTKAKPKPVMLEDDDEDDRPAPKKKSRPVVEVDDDEDRPRLKKKPAVMVDNDDEEDDDPRPKKKGKGKKKPPPKSNILPMLIGGGVAGLALVGFLVYWFVLREPEVVKGPVSTGMQPRINPPEGWIEDTTSWFSCWVPIKARLERNSDVEQILAAKAPGVMVWSSQQGAFIYQVIVFKMPPADVARYERDPDAETLEMARGFASEYLKAQIVTGSTITIDGQKGCELVLKDPFAHVRSAVHKGHMVHQIVTATNGITASMSDEHVELFFYKFKFRDGTSSTTGGNPQPGTVVNLDAALTGKGLSEAEAKHRIAVINDLKQLSLGFQFFDQGGVMPPADGAGIAVQGGQAGAKQFVGTSWRAVIGNSVSPTPFAMADQTRPKMEELGRELKRLESGDGKVRDQWNVSYLKNLQLTPYSCPIEGKTAAGWDTYFRVFIGNGAAFEPGKQLRFAAFTDGTANTLLVVEASQAVPWPKPEELAYDPNKPLPKLGGMFPDGFYAAFADGTVRFIKKGTDEKTIRAWITRNGGELVALPPAVNAEAMRTAAGYKD